MGSTMSGRLRYMWRRFRCVTGRRITMLQVGGWIEFDYTDTCGVHKHWFGEIKEVAHWGVRLFTQDGYRSFKHGRMVDIKFCA